MEGHRRTEGIRLDHLLLQTVGVGLAQGRGVDSVHRQMGVGAGNLHRKGVGAGSVHRMSRGRVRRMILDRRRIDWVGVKPQVLRHRAEARVVGVHGWPVDGVGPGAPGNREEETSRVPREVPAVSGRVVLRIMPDTRRRNIMRRACIGR